MSGHHHHRCDCAHQSVKYCKACLVAYCLDCGKEWRDSSTWTPTWTYSNALGQTTYPNSGTGTYPPGTVLCQHDTKG